MSFVELKNPKTEKYLELVKAIKCESFPWYFNYKVGPCPENMDTSWYSHAILTRPSCITGESTVASYIYYEYFINVLIEILNFNSIDVNHFYRINVNSTHSFSDLIAPTHVDHKFKHQQMILYLNTLESECPTYIFKKKWKDGDPAVYPQMTLEECINNFGIDATIQPKEDKIIKFDGLTYHTYGFPKNRNERRLCVVVTYSQK